MSSPNALAGPPRTARPDHAGPADPHLQGRRDSNPQPPVLETGGCYQLSYCPTVATTRVYSATLAVDAKAKALRQQDGRLSGSAQASPDFPTPDYIVEAAIRAARNQDAQVRARRRAARAAVEPSRPRPRDSRYQVTADQVLITNGGKQAVYQTFAALLDEGDEALLPPRTGPPTPRRSRSRAASGDRADHESTGYLASVEQLDAACTEQDQLLVFVSPSNPTGAVYPPEQVKAIGESAAAKGIWVVTDEIYKHLVYGDAKFSSIPVQAPEITNRCVVLNGVAKTYAMSTGWRVGWMRGSGRGRHQGGDQPAVARDLERGERCPGRGARRGVR